MKVTRLIKQRHEMTRFHVLLLQFSDILKKNTTILFFLIFEHAHLFNTGLPPGMLWLKQRNNNIAWGLFVMSDFAVFTCNINVYDTSSSVLTGTGWLLHQNLVVTSLGLMTRYVQLCSKVGINEMRSEWISLLHPLQSV